MELDEKLIESVAREMWGLLQATPDRDWAWCIENDAHAASELRFRAKCAIARAGIDYSTAPARPLDLRLKDALTSHARHDR